MQTTQTGSIFLPGQGRELPGILFKVAAAQAAGSFSIVEHPYQPGVLIPPPLHHAVDQVTYVIDGEVGIRVGDDTFNAPAGTYVIKPRGLPDTHWNATAHPAPRDGDDHSRRPSPARAATLAASIATAAGERWLGDGRSPASARQDQPARSRR